jgi:uracil-DNA glycosylase
MQQGRLFDLSPEPPSPPDAPRPSDFASIEAARAVALTCTRCDLAATRRQVVFGAGAPAARLMIVGEGPSEADDRTGHPFSGPSGPVLDQWLAALGLTRPEIWLTNVVRCRAMALQDGRPKNRPPTAPEMAACRAWLETEIGLVNPSVLLGLGATAGRVLTGSDFAFKRHRGQWRAGPGDRPTLVTFLPAYLLRLEEPALGQTVALVDADLAAVRAALAARHE